MNRVKYSILALGMLFVLSTGIFIVLAHEMVAEKEDWFDTRIFSFLKGYLSPGIIKLFKGLTFFGSTAFLISAFAVMILWLSLAKRRKDAVAVAIAGVSVCVLLEGLKLFFKRARPDMPVLDTLDNYSFPSGHAFYSFAFYSVLALLTWKTGWSQKWKIMLSIGLMFFVWLIGISRIVLRYHYSSDVLAGFCLGCSCLSVYLIYRVKRH